jgi:serine/threonine protein kinase
VFALKQMQKQTLVDSGLLPQIVREREVSAALSGHPFVLNLVASYQDASSLYLLTNLVDGPELFDLLHPGDDDAILSPEYVRFYAANVYAALEHIHSRGFVHRDVKSENVMVGANGYLSLIDYGFAKQLASVSGTTTAAAVTTTGTDTSAGAETGMTTAHAKAVDGGELTYTLCGTPEYLAPECVLHTGHDRTADLWALGCLLFEMLYGRTPFVGFDADSGGKEGGEAALYRNIALCKSGKFKPAFEAETEQESPGCVSFVSALLSPVPAFRPGGYMKTVQEHGWFAGFDWAKLRAQALEPPYCPPKRDEGCVDGGGEGEDGGSSRPRDQSVASLEMVPFRGDDNLFDGF